MGEWDGKKTEKLKKLWASGLSAAEIGRQLDVSKNSVIGKINRMGLSNRGSPIKGAPTYKSAANPKKRPGETAREKTAAPQKKLLDGGLKSELLVPVAQKAAQKRQKPAQNAKRGETSQRARTTESAARWNFASAGALLVDLASDMCCWPLDEKKGDDFVFCGKKVFRNRPYCLEHCAIAYATVGPASEKPQNADAVAIEPNDDITADDEE